MRYVIQTHADGQGDNLLWSTIPEGLARQGHEVKISMRPGWRNPEIRQLVWDHNPFISGFVDEPGNINWDSIRNYVIGRKSNDGMKRFEEVIGLPPVNKYPKIYYTPAFVPEFHDKVVASLTSISQGFPKDEIERFVRYLAKNNGVDYDQVIILKSRFDGESGRDALPDNPRYEVSSLFEKCNIIFSCRYFLAVDSGDNSLAAAIRGHGNAPDISVLTTTMSFTDRLFMWPNVHYVPIGGLTPNYKEWNL